MGASLRSDSTRWFYLGLSVLGFCIFGLATGVLMSEPMAVIGMDRLGELTCLQMAGSSERAAAILSAFNAAELLALQQLLIPGDMVFAWGYGFLFSGLLGLLTLRLSGAWFAAGKYLMWAPLLASVFDVLEDIGLHELVATFATQPAELSSAVAAFTTASASVKYILLAIIGPAYGVSGSIKAIAADRRPGSIGLYILVVLLAASMVQKPLLEIPACF